MLCQINTLNTLFNIISDSPDDSRGVSPCNSANPTLGRRSSYKTSRGKFWQHFRWLCRNCCVVYVNSGSSNISTLHDICPILGIYYIIFFCWYILYSIFVLYLASFENSCWLYVPMFFGFVHYIFFTWLKCRVEVGLMVQHRFWRKRWVSLD